jgi:hypothetical protein
MLKDQKQCGDWGKAEPDNEKPQSPPAISSLVSQQTGTDPEAEQADVQADALLEE